MKPTQEQVIAWAWKAADGVMSFDAYGTEILSKHEFIELATLAYEAGRKDENEACALVCEAESSDPSMPESYADNHADGWADGCDSCAAAIRARREQ